MSKSKVAEFKRAYSPDDRPKFGPVLGCKIRIEAVEVPPALLTASEFLLRVITCQVRSLLSERLVGDLKITAS